MAAASWGAQALWLVGRLQPLTPGFSMALGLVAHLPKTEVCPLLQSHPDTALNQGVS